MEKPKSPTSQRSVHKREAGSGATKSVNCKERALHSKGRLAGNEFKQRKLSRLVQRI